MILEKNRSPPSSQSRMNLLIKLMMSIQDFIALISIMLKEFQQIKCLDESISLSSRVLSNMLITLSLLKLKFKKA